MALAEFKIHLDLAAAGKIDPAVQPTALYLFHNDLVLTAIESGSYTPEKVREISVRLNETCDVMNKLDKQWRSPSTAASRQRTPKSRAREVWTLRGVFSRNRLAHIGGQLAIVQS